MKLFIFLVVVPLALSSCISVSSSINTPVIGFSFYEKNVSSLMIQNTLRQQSKKKKLRPIIKDSQENTNTQIKHITSLIKQPVDVILVQTSHIWDLKKIYSTITKLEVTTPIIFITLDQSIFEIIDTHEIKNSIANIIIFGQEVGKSQAYFIQNRLPKSESINVALLVDTIGSTSQLSRTQGFEKEIQNTNISITYQESANSKRIGALRIVEKWLKTEHTFNVIVANNDIMALGAILALKEHDVKKDIVVMGGELLEDSIASIKNGDMAMSLLIDAQTIIDTALQFNTYWKENIQFNQVISVPPIIVTQKNIHLFFITK